MKKIGIYKITCINNNKVRIGHASDIYKRWSSYKAALRKNKCKIHDMQQDWNIYGEKNFKFEIIEECVKHMLKERENFYILKHNSIKNGYNQELNDLNIPKKIRRGIEAKTYREERSKITAGENNGHNTKLTKEDVFQILDMKKRGIDLKTIAAQYNVSCTHANNIGKCRWMGAYEEWKDRLFSMNH